MSECRYEGGVSTISAVRCPDELIPEPWLEDPPSYITVMVTLIFENIELSFFHEKYFEISD